MHETASHICNAYDGLYGLRKKRRSSHATGACGTKNLHYHKVGSDVEVEVEMKNISAEGVGFVPTSTMSSSTTSFRWDIREGAGKEVPMTEYGLKANCLDSPG